MTPDDRASVHALMRLFRDTKPGGFAANRLLHAMFTLIEKLERLNARELGLDYDEHCWNAALTAAVKICDDMAEDFSNDGQDDAAAAATIVGGAIEAARTK